jgi:replicative DNA helicase
MQAQMDMSYCGTALYKSAMSRERATRVAAIVQSQELVRLATSDVYWDEIVSIEPDGDEEVYDLTVEDLHNFVAADVLTHNSIEQDSDVVMFIYRDEVYNPDTERPNIADIIIAKHRNGPIGQISLYFQAAQTRYRDLDLRIPDSY